MDFYPPSLVRLPDDFFWPAKLSIEETHQFSPPHAPKAGVPQSHPLAHALGDIVCTPDHGFAPPVPLHVFADLLEDIAWAPREDFPRIARLLARALGLVLPPPKALRGSGFGRRLRAQPPQACGLSELLTALGASSRSRRPDRPEDRRRWSLAFERALAEGHDDDAAQRRADLLACVLLLRYAFGGPACELSPRYDWLRHQMCTPVQDPAAVEDLIHDAMFRNLYTRMAALSMPVAPRRAALQGMREKRDAGLWDAEQYRGGMLHAFDTMAGAIRWAAGMPPEDTEAVAPVAASDPVPAWPCAGPPLFHDNTAFEKLGIAQELHGHAAALRQAWCSELLASKGQRDWQEESKQGIEALWPDALPIMLVETAARATPMQRLHRMQTLGRQLLVFFELCAVACGTAAADTQRLLAWMRVRIDEAVAHFDWAIGQVQTVSPLRETGQACGEPAGVAPAGL
ncbi:hypothetical protein GT347_22880 [Xylophilus rhododendri]|uniref:Uncharacterized protein n=1 Tax=Xylophilus rhododendri TaxID=2697032 RepID=A0A857JC89_9BURK|nr:hypothetical protein [Xylophilus rhododendri]QHJ00573.1 hypothetical protein GT347_22880 [Xylophilus rhododendri]